MNENLDDKQLIEIFKKVSLESKEFKKIEKWLDSMDLTLHHWVMSFRKDVEMQKFKKLQRLVTEEEKELGKAISVINSSGSHRQRTTANSIYRYFLRYGKTSRKQKSYIKMAYKKSLNRR